MKLELLASFKGMNELDLTQFIDAAIKNKVAYLCVSPDLVKIAYEYLQNYENFPKISALINFPNGNDTPSVKLHSILNAKKHQASAIDIPINISLLRTCEETFFNEIISIHNFCLDHQIVDRFTLEYRYLDEEELVRVVCFLSELGVGGIVNATGTVIDDTIDNMINAKGVVQMSESPVIVCGRILSQQHIEMFLGIGLSAIRFRDIHSLNKGFSFLKKLQKI